MLSDKDWDQVRTLLRSSEGDAQLIFWGPEADIKTGLETIDERCRLAFAGVPNETRKVFEDGTTIFERVLPGADRMYPDTDSKPIPLEDARIEEIRKMVPTEVADRYRQLKDWGVPEDCYTYIFVRNLYPVIEKISQRAGAGSQDRGRCVRASFEEHRGALPEVAGLLLRPHL